MNIIEYPYEDGIKIKIGDTTVLTITKFDFTSEEPPSSTYPGAPSDIEVLEVWVQNDGRLPFQFSPQAAVLLAALYQDEIRKEILLHREAMNESHDLERKLEAHESKRLQNNDWGIRIDK